MNYRLETAFTEEQIQTRVRELAAQISEDYHNEPIILLVLLKGSVFFASDLARHLTIPLIMEFIHYTSYCGTKSTNTINIDYDIKTEKIKDKNILIVEDLYDSGLTLFTVKKNLIERGAKNVKICTFLRKNIKHIYHLEPEYVGFTIPNHFIVGYGCDYYERFRNLTSISYLYEE